ALLLEKEALEEERKNLPKDNETENRRAAMVIDGKLKLLNERILSARILEIKGQPTDEVRFGAIVKFDNGRKIQEFQIVGADEADIKQQKIAFTAPIAKIMIGKKVNETADFIRGNHTQKLKIL